MIPAGLDITPLGPNALLITWPQEPTPGLARLLGKLAEKGRSIPGVLDAWPGLRELALQFDPNKWDFADLANHCLDIGEHAAADALEDVANRQHTLPVTYDGADLEAVAQACELSIDQVIEKHSAATYTVAIIGFVPYFPYLLGLPEALRLPRLSTPRKRVPAGSVAIADSFAGVYPKVSPGGWHLLGSTDAELLKELQPGDEVVFAAQTRC